MGEKVGHSGLTAFVHRPQNLQNVTNKVIKKGPFVGIIFFIFSDYADPCWLKHDIVFYWYDGKRGG